MNVIYVYQQHRRNYYADDKNLSFRIIVLVFIEWFYDNSVDGRNVRAPIMMAKSHKRALYYTVVEIRILTYIHRKTLSLQRNYGGPMPL